jgi:hypothetical protein
MLRGYVTERQIARQGAEERNSVANEHRHSGDDETLNQTGAQEPLNRVDSSLAAANRLYVEE